jgi:hypothetical protein
MISTAFNRRSTLALSASAVLAGCATRPADPRPAPAPLTLTEAFVGRTRGEGVFRFPIARVERRFTAELDGRLEGDRLTVVEDFAYADGEKDRLTWVFDRAGPGRWTGKREDTVGAATVTEANGLIRLEYLADVRSRGNVTRLGFRDLIYRASPELIVNEAVVAWRGLPLGSVRFEIRRA